MEKIINICVLVGWNNGPDFDTIDYDVQDGAESAKNTALDYSVNDESHAYCVVEDHEVIAAYKAGEEVCLSMNLLD